MIANYFKIAWRNLRKNKLYSFINIIGLSIGICCCVMIFLYVQYERSYDKYNTKGDRIFRLTELLHMPKEDRKQASTSPPIASMLKNNFPEVEKVARIISSSRDIRYKDKRFDETRIMYADSSFFDIFTFPMTAGDPHAALTQPYSAVLTETTAKKYFGDEPALGKTFLLSDTINVQVTGIIKDVPQNSHFTFDCLLSMRTLRELNNNAPEDKSWFYNAYYTYLLLRDRNAASQLEQKSSAFIQKQMAEEKKASGLWYDLVLQPLTDIHLRSNINSELGTNSDITYVYIFSGIAVLILLIACCNFINLSTARSLNRSKEIGLRKVIGAGRRQLIFQFLGESLIFTFIAGIFAIVLTFLFLPAFNNFTGKQFSFAIFEPASLALYIGLLLCIGLLAGFYPAVLMSSFKPISSLKGNVRHGWQDIVLRKGLVIFQFTIAIVLIIGTLLTREQLQFIQNTKLGLNKDQLVEVALPGRVKPEQRRFFMAESGKIKGVISESLTNFSFKNHVSNIVVLPEGTPSTEVSSHSTITIDETFLPTFSIPLVAGRNFSKEYTTDSASGFIVNEAAVKAFGWKTPQQAVGKNINWGLGKKGQVVGVVKDFNYTSLHDQINPLVLHMLPEWASVIAIKLKATDISETIQQLENKWKSIIPGISFSYSFMNDDFATLYKSEQNLQAVMGLFTILSILVACLGLFGLATFAIEQRIKEIGIRKVLGASVISITSLLSKDFLKLVLVSVLIAAPVAWFGMNKWLQHFAYRTPISWWVFVIAAGGSLLVALATISFQSMKAAVSNPIKSLRTE